MWPTKKAKAKQKQANKEETIKKSAAKVDDIDTLKGTVKPASERKPKEPVKTPKPNREQPHSMIWESRKPLSDRTSQF